MRKHRGGCLGLAQDTKMLFFFEQREGGGRVRPTHLERAQKSPPHHFDLGFILPPCPSKVGHYPIRSDGFTHLGPPRCPPLNGFESSKVDGPCFPPQTF